MRDRDKERSWQARIVKKRVRNRLSLNKICESYLTFDENCNDESDKAKVAVIEWFKPQCHNLTASM